MPIYLGLDSSTQSLTAVAIRIPERAIAALHTVNFQERLPEWGTESGVLRSEDPRVNHSPPLMWVEALELLLSDMRAAGFPFEEVRAIAGSGQQHGSVYLGREAEADKVLKSVRPDMNVIENQAYHKLCLFYKGELTREKLTEGEDSRIMNDAAAYGLSNWFLVNDRKEEAKEVCESILRGDTWASFGFIAAEADRIRFFKPR